MIQTGFLYNDLLLNIKQIFLDSPTVQLKWQEEGEEKSTLYTFGFQGISEIDLSWIPQYPFLCIEFEGAKEEQSNVPYGQKDITATFSLHYYSEEMEKEVNFANIHQTLWAITVLLGRNKTLNGYCRDTQVLEVIPGYRPKENGFVQGGVIRIEATKRVSIL